MSLHEFFEQTGRENNLQFTYVMTSCISGNFGSKKVDEDEVFYHA
jgi:hypothetical protein